MEKVEKVDFFSKKWKKSEKWKKVEKVEKVDDLTPWIKIFGTNKFTINKVTS